MSTATASPPIETAPDETFVATQEYVSACNNLVLRMGTDYGFQPARKIFHGEGAEFEQTPGRGIKFIEGRYRTAKADEIAFLDRHDRNGVDFHKVGYGPDGKPADDTGAVIKAIVDCAFDGNYQQIADILVAERVGDKRPAVIAACESAMKQLGDLAAAYPPAPTE